jgi:hypothetical protein
VIPLAPSKHSNNQIAAGPMTLQTILLPLFVEVTLTFVLMFWMAISRTRAFNSGAVKPDDIALREPNWPKQTTQIAYSFSNQFELPVLFYVLTILAIITDQAGRAFVVMAWIFVVFRLAQAFVHTTSNIVRLRGSLYAVGAVVLAAMWLIFIVEVLTGT